MASAKQLPLIVQDEEVVLLCLATREAKVLLSFIEILRDETAGADEIYDIADVLKKVGINPVPCRGVI